MSIPQIFEFGNHAVRVIDKDGNPWFVAKDVAEALGYERPKDAVYAHCKGGGKMQLPSAGGQQEYTIIPEGDVYRLVMRSHLPSALKFQDWIMDVVIPAIRKTGKYEATPQSHLETARQLVASLEHNERLQAQVTMQKPKVEAYDDLMSADDGFSIGHAGKILGIGPGVLFKRLKKMKVLMADNLPYQKFAQHFKVAAKSYGPKDEKVPYTQTLVTPQGLIWLRELLGGNDAEPGLLLL